MTEIADLFGALAVDHLWSQQSETGMMMLSVVPGEELLAKAPGMVQGAEAVWKLRPILQGLKLAFGEGIVVGDVRAAMGFGHAELRIVTGFSVRW